MVHRYYTCETPRRRTAGLLHEALCKELAFEQWEAPVEPSAAGLPQALVALLAGSLIEQMLELCGELMLPAEHSELAFCDTLGHFTRGAAAV